MRYIFFFSFLVPACCASAQQTAVTQTGERVVLYSDGHWEYVNRDSLNELLIPTNPEPFVKSKKSDFLLKSKRIPIGVWLDPKAWTFEAQNAGEAAEYELDHKNGSLYALMINENLDVPLTTLGNIALDNAREAAPDVKVISKEYRKVNGLTILMMRMTGTIQDIRFSYYGYYYAGNGHATQFLVYTSEDFMEENIPVVEELLNGLVETDR